MIENFKVESLLQYQLTYSGRLELVAWHTTSNPGAVFPSYMRNVSINYIRLQN